MPRLHTWKIDEAESSGSFGQDQFVLAGDAKYVLLSGVGNRDHAGTAEQVGTIDDALRERLGFFPGKRHGGVLRRGHEQTPNRLIKVYSNENDCQQDYDLCLV